MVLWHLLNEVSLGFFLLIENKFKSNIMSNSNLV
jgi:hypothetical protein